jgi:hypothetical protein
MAVDLYALAQPQSGFTGECVDRHLRHEADVPGMAMLCGPAQSGNAAVAGSEACAGRPDATRAYSILA